MTAGGALGADAQGADGERDVVRDHKHVIRGDLVEAGGLADGLAREVHIGLGLHQQHVCLPDGAGGGQRAKARAVDADVLLPGKGVRGHEAGVVPGALIAQAGIAQEDDEPGDGAGRKKHVRTSAQASNMLAMETSS